MRISKGHRELACAIFDLLQLMWREDEWDLLVSRRREYPCCGEVLGEEDKVVIYANAHVGGLMGPMAKTLLHEQLHAVMGMRRGNEREEALVTLCEEYIWQGIDKGRRGQLEFLLKEAG